MLKNISFIFVAVIIDLLQIGTVAAFIFIGAFSGTLGGAAAGGKVADTVCGVFGGGFLYGCQQLGTTIGAIIGSLANPLLALWAVPISTFMGFIVNSAISVSIGTGFILLLMQSDMLSFNKDWGTVIPAYIAKILPLFNVLPCWTIMVVLLSIKKTPLGNVLDVKKVTIDAVKGAIEGAELGPEGMLAGAAVAVTKGATKRLVNDGINGKINVSKQPSSGSSFAKVHEFIPRKNKEVSPPSHEIPDKFAA